MKFRGYWVCVLPAVSCGAGSTDSAGLPPDVAGRYQVFITSVSGCDNDASLVQPWAQGPLTVSQEGETVSLDYGEDAVLDGSVDGDGAFVASGGLDWSGRTMALYQDGLFSREDGTWTASARFENRVSEDGLESNDCTQQANMEATRLAD